MAVAKTANNVRVKKVPSKTVAGTGHFNWLAIIVVGWALLVGASLYERYRPASDWLMIEQVHVDDVKLSDNPEMKYTRTIKQPFVGEWLAEVQMRHPDGTWETFCASTGRSNYAPDKAPPNLLTLKWWTYPVDCTPKHAGKYRLATSWTTELPGGLTKQVFAISNTFNVTE